MKRLYLYLASRSKKGIKLVTVLQSESVTTSKLTDLSSLDLPPIWERQISQIIHENRMLYEPWVETAKDFNELVSRLKERGYSDMSVGVNPLLEFKAYSVAPVADTSSCKVTKTMIKRKQ
jgi:hypothetical protein